MRQLSPRPLTVLDARTRAPVLGAFRSGLPPFDPSVLGKNPLFRIAHEKRWVYVAIAAGDLLVAAAITHFGYASNTFAFVYDRALGRMVGRYSAVAPAFAAEVGKTGGEGCYARFHGLGARLAIERGLGERDYRVEITAPDLRVSARLSSEGMPPPIGVVAKLEGPPGLFNGTEKGVLMPAVGEVLAGGRHYTLDGGLGGYDYTSGFLQRHTAWRWAFALGRARSAERVGLNLVEGFVGEDECALWIDGELYPLSEGRFELDPKAPLQPWRVRTADGEVDLRFDPGAIHAETHDFGIVSSRFIQPAGGFSGTVRVPGRAPLELDGVLGVVEDQDVTW